MRDIYFRIGVEIIMARILKDSTIGDISFLDFCHPIGSIFESISSTPPTNYLVEPGKNLVMVKY